MLIAIALALAGALSNATSNVLQRMADKDESDQRSLSPKLIWSLMHRKVWLCGLATMITSFALQAAALHFGQLVLVQPIIALELPLTLIGAGILFRAGLGWHEWGSVTLMTVGLAILIGFLDPHAARSHQPDTLAWIVGVATCLSVIAGLVLVALRQPGLGKAALFGAATGIGFGLTAAFTRAAMIALGHGIGALLSSWPTYALAASGLGSMFLMQNALQAGRLVAAQPGITILDPFAAILWGMLAFGERARPGLGLAAAGAGAALTVAGAIALSRSSVLDPDQDRQVVAAGERA